jgi:cell division protein FtsW (lipid II flippase)
MFNVNVNRRYIADFDWGLLGLALGVAAFGVLEIWSVEPSPGLWRRQLVGIGIGLVVMFLTTRFDYRRVVNAAPYLYGVGVILLLLVLSPLGKVVNNNKSWLEIGSFSFQPSEMAKIFTLMFLAYYLAGVRKRPIICKRLRSRLGYGHCRPRSFSWKMTREARSVSLPFSQPCSSSQVCVGVGWRRRSWRS